MKIAILGAGYAGLSVCWHPLQLGIETTLFDAVGLGGGASGASTGLLHPYPARMARRSARADEALREAFLLLEVAESALGLPVASHSGILKLAMNEEQEKAFARPLPDAQLLSRKEVQHRFPQVAAREGLWIPQGKTVFASRYLQGLWRACEQRGAALFRQKIETLDELSSFDRIVLTNGAQILLFAPDLSVQTKHGQALVCRWPQTLQRPPCSLIGHGHLSLTEDPDVCLLGSTYEQGFDPAKALALREQISSFYPPALQFEILGVRSGIRMTPKNGYLPLTLQLTPTLWAFTGLGSRGLLYHGLYGKELVAKLI